VVNPVLAHMGGIDEIGIFVIPALLAIYALKRAERQARMRAEAEAEGVTVDDGSSLTIDDETGTEAVPPPA
jgi:hypothetical protein